MADIIAAVEAIVLRETGQQVFRSGWDGFFTPAAGELVEELGKAGYGLVDPLAAALAGKEGHALVKAIHDRKAEA